MYPAWLCSSSMASGCLEWFPSMSSVFLCKRNRVVSKHVSTEASRCWTCSSTVSVESALAARACGWRARSQRARVSVHPEAAKIVNLHFPLIYIFARIYIPNLRKLKGKCKFYIFPKNVFFRRKIEDFCKNENFHFFLHTKNYYFFSISLVSSLDF